MFQTYLKIVSSTLLIITPYLSVAEESTSLGLALGSPAAINFVIKSDKLGVPLQLSGGYWGDQVSGVEVGYGFYKNDDAFFSSVQFIMGYSDLARHRNRSEKWKYAGISGTFRKGGFFFEPGITVGSGDYSNPQVTVQIGWLWDL